MISKWLQQSWQRLLYLMGLLLTITIVSGYVFDWNWVGVGDYFGPTNLTNQVFERSKTVWDWLEVFIIPVILGMGIWWLNAQQTEISRAIASENQNQTTMNQYFDRMTDLLFTPGVIQSDSDTVVKAQVIGRARTLDVFHSLDGKRKGQILQFLQEADLITYKVNEDDAASFPFIRLKRADLTGIELEGANLEQAVLEDLSLDRANLNNAYLNLYFAR